MCAGTARLVLRAIGSHRQARQGPAWRARRQGRTLVGARREISRHAQRFLDDAETVRADWRIS